MRIVIGFKGWERDAEPHVVYCGRSSEASRKAIAASAGKGFVRMGELVNPELLKVRVPAEAAPAPVVPVVPTPTPESPDVLTSPAQADVEAPETIVPDVERTEAANADVRPPVPPRKKRAQN